MNKPKAVVFYQYLPPWRIDVFNAMGEYYDMTIVFTNANSDGFTYNRQELLSKLVNIKTLFLNNGFKIGSRPIRFGIYNILKTNRPDVVFSHEYSPTSILIALYKQIGLLHYNYYLTTSDNLAMAESVSGLKAICRKYVLNHSNGAIVYSNTVKEWYQQHFLKLKIQVCPNIQNSDTLLEHLPSLGSIIDGYKNKYNLTKTNIILYVGRLVEAKGLDLLLNAFAKATIEHYTLIIVGEGKLHIELSKLAEKLGIADKVVFAGQSNGEYLYAWYNMANYFILPSRYEPFGAVINEALVYGCPVVASKYIGATDFININNGVLFDPLNENEFKTVLQESCRKYKNKTKERQNLMSISFKDYISVFKTINE